MLTQYDRDQVQKDIDRLERLRPEALRKGRVHELEMSLDKCRKSLEGETERGHWMYACE